MINGDPHDFIEKVGTGQDIEFMFHGIVYWYQGYNRRLDGKWHMEIYPMDDEKNAINWICDVQVIEEGLRIFQETNIFDGKTFWEAEEEIEWID